MRAGSAGRMIVFRTHHAGLVNEIKVPSRRRANRLSGEYKAVCGLAPGGAGQSIMEDVSVIDARRKLRINITCMLGARLLSCWRQPQDGEAFGKGATKLVFVQDDRDRERTHIGHSTLEMGAPVAMEDVAQERC